MRWRDSGPRGRTRDRWGMALARFLVLAMTATLLGRLWYLQLPMGEHYQRLAADNRVQELVVPATRGQILDAAGRPLVRNRTELVVSADYHELAEREDDGEAVLRRVADLLELPYEKLRQRTRLCGPDVSRPCWPGSPYQPITLAEGVEQRRALQIMERQEDFPGITAQQHPRRDYVRGDDAAQVLGYLQPVTEAELAERKELRKRFTGVDLVGRGGLEAVYDDRLRGTSGLRRLAVDNHGNVTGTISEEAPRSGKHLVTSLDARVQSVVEKALEEGLDQARSSGYPADAAAGVVMDVRNGRVIAMASLPGYDPSVWQGGIDDETYERLLSEDAGNPLTSRVTQGEFPPASTFKVSSLSAAVEDGYPLDGTYSCPSAYTVGDRPFHNYGGSAHGNISLHKAIVVSCNTVFYRFGHEQWKNDGGKDPAKKPEEPMARMAEGFGFGSPTGIDLPHESGGRIPDREWKRRYWEETHDRSCERAESGYPDVAENDPAHARYLRAVAEEHCVEGHVFRAGDAANFAIGQGDVLVTPLQLVRAYAAIANGGTLYEPRLGKALLEADGSGVTEIEPVKAGELPVSDRTLEYLRGALAEVPKSGTASGAFGGFPQDEVSIAGKTGTATMTGRKESAWFASYAPADDPRFAVVALISQGGTGGSAAAPVVRRIYEGIYGFTASEPGADSEESDSGGAGDPAFPNGEPPAELPTVRSDGTVVSPDGSAR